MGSFECGSHGRGPRWFPRCEFPTPPRPITVSGSFGTSRVSDRSITPSPHCLARSCISSTHSALLCYARLAESWSSHRAQHRFSSVNLSRYHQLPGDARYFIRQRHRNHLRRLALEHLDKPRRGKTSTVSHMTDDGGGAKHQNASQGLIASARDTAEPDLFQRSNDLSVSGPAKQRSAAPTGIYPGQVSS